MPAESSTQWAFVRQFCTRRNTSHCWFQALGSPPTSLQQEKDILGTLCFQFFNFCYFCSFMLLLLSLFFCGSSDCTSLRASLRADYIEYHQQTAQFEGLLTCSCFDSTLVLRKVKKVFRWELLQQRQGGCSNSFGRWNPNVVVLGLLGPYPSRDNQCTV